MKRRFASAAAVFVITAAVAGCDTEVSGTGGGTSSGSTTKTTNTASSSSGTTTMCIQPGDPGNDIGIGAYCTPGGNECKKFPLASLCLADVGQDEHFCTRIGCDETTNCGMGAGCLLDPAGSACVPCKCDDAGVGCTMTSATSSGSGSTGSGASTGTGN